MKVYYLLCLFVCFTDCYAVVNKGRNVEVKDSNQSGSEYRERNTGGRVRFEDGYDDYDGENGFARGRQRIRFDGPVTASPISPTSISYVRHDIPVIGYRNSNPNVQVESTYRNVKHTSGPAYKQVIVTEVQDDNVRQPRKNTVITRGAVNPRYKTKEPRHQGRSHTEYASKTMVKYPDGYEKGERRRTEERSQYKQDSNSKQGYKKPPIIEVGTSPQVRYTKPAKNIKVIKNQPLEEASSSYGGAYVSDDIDDGEYEDRGFVGNYGRGYDRGRHYEKEGGKKYETGHHVEEGEKGDKGYKAEHAYEKGESAKHGAEENKGELSESEGEKKSHIDAGTKFVEGNKKAEGAKADNFVHKTGHRKGHKKTGFHRVHRKDEYKNDEEFFDEEHDSGEEQKQGHSHLEHAQAEGESEKTGHHDAAYLEKQSGQKGEQEKGLSYNEEEGYKGEKGHESHHGENSEFSKKGGFKQGEAHKHSDLGGGGILYRD